MKVNPGGGEGIGCALLRGYAPILRIACSPMGLTEPKFSSLRASYCVPSR